ncbi:TatD family hydrolase [Thiolapillus sp.]
MLIDSHCHLDRVDLSPYQNDFSVFMRQTRQAGVDHMLCVSIDLESYPDMLALVLPYEDISVSVGVHPNDFDRREPGVDDLVELSSHPRNVAIGETGLDFFRSEGDLEWQRQRFRTHIRAAIEAEKPLVIHTRDAREETLAIMQAEKAERAGGVLHCFTENWEMASAALDMGFYISFSGIVTFKNAQELRDVAARAPLDKLLIETDAPYLAPTPYRGKPNEPKYVIRVAETIAELRGMDTEDLATQTAKNFQRLFKAGIQT